MACHVTAETVDIIVRQRMAAVKVACRAIGIRGTVQGYALSGRVRFTITPDSSWTHDQVMALADALGTQDISFEYDGVGADEGGQAEVMMWVSWRNQR